MTKFQKLIARLLIPRGYYCEGCPFWYIDSSKPERMNGYCSYLEKGDWDFYEEIPDKISIQRRQPDGSYRNEMIDKDPIYGTMLWEGLKVC